MEAMILTGESHLMSCVVAYGVAGRALQGERESGDLHVVAPFCGGVLIAVADGLGHGVEAAAAARAAAASLRECPDFPVADLLSLCHAALHGTRGVVLGLASINADSNQLNWVGVGNIDATLIRADRAAPRETLPSRGGVVGHQMPPLRVTVRAIAPGDTLILMTDGIDGNLRLGASIDWAPQELADYIVQRHGKDTDDALALVARYVGCRSP
jgi:phosphoserine phosphatase RsbX